MEELEAILNRADQGLRLEDRELAVLLELSDEVQREKLFAAARRSRSRFFGDEVFLYGFVYFSTYCRNACNFCYYRNANTGSIRYRKSLAEVLEIAAALKESGVHLLDLTMGEDPYYLSSGEEGYDRLVELVHQVKEQTGLPLMISPGGVPEKLLPRLQAAGADWYACYQETHTLELYNRMRVHQPYRERWDRKVAAHGHGMLVEEGLLVGIGEETADVVHSLRQMELLQAEQVRTMTFVPQAGTPMAARKASDNRLEVNIIAVMRLLFPDRLIPASLDVEGIHGLKARINAGANVVTSIIPPHEGLAGVANSVQDIAEGYRTVAGVTPVLAECGLRPASVRAYADWVASHEKSFEKVIG